MTLLLCLCSLCLGLSCCGISAVADHAGSGWENQQAVLPDWKQMYAGEGVLAKIDQVTESEDAPVLFLPEMQ